MLVAHTTKGEAVSGENEEGTADVGRQCNP
jgi:hypothetical protein